jgi:alkylglycerol monooxygenase
MSLNIVIISAQILTAVLSLGILLVELGLHLTGRRHDYRFGDTVANFATTVVYGALGGLAIACILPVYEAIRTHFGVFDIKPAAALWWIVGLVCADFCHYWFHRAAHRNNFMWGIHQGHHSSDDFNLSIAIRKGIFQQWVDWPFFLPMALLGFPFFTMYLPLKGAQFAYQFWIHNKFVGKLGPIEKIMVTPSLHRVHHGQNEPYVDKNYAGVFILWDRLFGSYAQETEPVVYGISTQVRTFNPLSMQFTYWRQLWRDARASDNKWAVFKIWFMPTGWRPADRRQVPWPDKVKDPRSYDKYDPKIDGRTKAYVLTQVVLLALLTATLEGANGNVAVTVSNLLVLVLILWSSWSIGLLLDRRLRNGYSEIVRLAVIAAFAIAALAVPLPAPKGVEIAVLVTIAASLLALSLRRATQPAAQLTTTP